MKKGYYGSGYTISDIYQGGYSSLNPPSGPYNDAGSLGMTTDSRVANILQEFSSKLSSGTKNIEIEGVSPEIFDSIPKQHLKEVNRLSKLTGVDVSLHGPIVEPSGITQQGYSESERESAERRIIEALLRAQELNPKGNIPVTFHSSAGIPGSQFIPPSKRKGEEKYQRIVAIDREQGTPVALEADVKYYPGMKEEDFKEGRYQSPETKIKIINESKWDNSINQLLFSQERAQEILGKNQIQIQHLLEDIREMKEKKGIHTSDILKTLSPQQKNAWMQFEAARTYLEDIQQQANNLFSNAYKFGTEQQRGYLKKINEEFKSILVKNGNDPFAYSEAVRYLTGELKGITPQLYEPIEKFAIEKSAQTFGKAAFEAYKKFNDKSPTLVIENPPAGGGLSTGEDIKNIVEESRKQFIENAKKEGVSEIEASKMAKKLIGATWDVGHINMLRKFGYTEKDIIRETEKVAPYVKHLHLSDNFGFEHTELPMGMGNVPLKEIMERLGEQGFEGKKIIEASSWWQHFKTPPFQESLEAMGSPVYSMKMSPYWSQSTGLYQGYFSGYGNMLPQINYESFGSGFSRLPSELGGPIPGAQGGRMSGRPME